MPTTITPAHALLLRTVSQLITADRIAAGLTVADLATRSGIPKVTLTRALAGARSGWASSEWSPMSSAVVHPSGSRLRNSRVSARSTLLMASERLGAVSDIRVVYNAEHDVVPFTENDRAHLQWYGAYPAGGESHPGWVVHWPDGDSYFIGGDLLDVEDAVESAKGLTEQHEADLAELDGEDGTGAP